MLTADIDIVVPVYNEGDNIQKVLESFKRHIKSKYRVLICYDFDGDTTIPAVKIFLAQQQVVASFATTNNSVPVTHNNEVNIEFIKNSSRGPHAAVCSGFKAATAPAVLVWPGDDDYNAAQIDKMAAALKTGAVIVTATRFMPGGSMQGCPLLKSILVRGSAWCLYFLAGVPCRDASNGLRMFAKSFLDVVTIESNQGFTYSIELLVKAHRLQKKVVEVPVQWFERQAGRSRFKIGGWLGAYLKWFFYAFATSYLGRRQL